jgi:hypothetical protein
MVIKYSNKYSIKIWNGSKRRNDFNHYDQAQGKNQGANSALVKTKT